MFIAEREVDPFFHHGIDAGAFAASHGGADIHEALQGRPPVHQLAERQSAVDIDCFEQRVVRESRQGG